MAKMSGTFTFSIIFLLVWLINKDSKYSSTNPTDIGEDISNLWFRWLLTGQTLIGEDGSVLCFYIISRLQSNMPTVTIKVAHFDCRILKPTDGTSVFRSKVQHMHHKAMFIQLQKLLNDVGFTPEVTCPKAMIFWYCCNMLRARSVIF